MPPSQTHNNRHSSRSSPEHRTTIQPIRRDRISTLVNDARSSNGFPHLGQLPQGPGHWEWLEEGVDDVRAQAMGFRRQADVELARQHGHLTHGMGADAGPFTVWYPDMKFFNPTVQPRGFGHWAYHTTHGDGSDRAYARLRFGDQEAYGLLGDSAPAARHIWRIRQEYWALLADGEVDVDPTDLVNLVWIAGEIDPDDFLAAFATPEPEGAEESEPLVGHAVGDVDSKSGESHVPRNRGGNDQARRR
ncbi:hypothetical protein LTR08_000913 [Meristemomyces frigidus]|nr:hypothetical protein LTR08_000913 [Meristemomyces frigidus]